MHRLTHYPLCPRSRAIRLALGELDIGLELAEMKPWDVGPAFLALNPAGELPVLALETGFILHGTYAISEYVGEEITRHPVDGGPVPLFPGNREERAEVRRLVDWFLRKFHDEVGLPVLEEKVYRRFRAGTDPAPDVDVLRAARHNLRYHLSYVAYLTNERNWLAGEMLSFADFAAAAELSAMDYLGEVPWDDHPAARLWYARIKSRPAFRPLLAERVPEAPPPPAHYPDLDF